uniref:Proliferating cell nuclear antigen n=1 Tax=Pithovirus LCPAC202 TaxID=2506592 RepID=A0A481Z5R3_9VIRU|nr:MAG: proliferating cell nuclear antigen [Pithovirus LCPAC202]
MVLSNGNISSGKRQPLQSTTKLGPVDGGTKDHSSTQLSIQSDNDISHQIVGSSPGENSPKTLNVSTSNKTDISCSFNVEFPHAGAFSALIEYLHGGHGTGTTNQSYFEITEKTLTYTGRDVSKTVLNCATIYSRNTVRFIMSSTSETYRFFVKLKELRDHLKPFTKKNSVALTKYKGRSQLYIQTSSSGSDFGPQQIQFVNLLPMDGNVKYNFPTHSPESLDTPNAVIYAPELHKMCKTIVTDRQIEICGTKTSICFGIPGKDEQRPSSVWKFTSPNNNSLIGTDDNIIVGKASGGVIKNLGRLSALAPNALIWVYFTSEKDIKLVAPIEYLGTLDVHITLSQV